MLPSSLLDQLPTVARCTPISGGDICRAFRLDLTGGRRLFAKCHDRPPPGFFAAEADGLAALARSDASLTPTVVAQSADGLALEWLQLRPGGCGAELGRAVARLHRQPAASFGGQADNYIGDLPQRQPPCASWAELYRDHRLAPLAERLPKALRRDLDRLLPRLEQLLALPDPPSPVHGDLWGGNGGETQDGRAVLFDPSFATAHREVDLAMTRLFGGFSTDFYAAYEEVYPLTAGWQERTALHQIYPVLVHVVLFGSAYIAQASAAMRPYL
jgi:fructosamine-3-kinase